MIPDFEQLMRPVLEAAEAGEVAISEVVHALSEKLELSELEKSELLPSGKQTRFANRVHWARSYLKQAGLVRNTSRGRYVITDQGRRALSSTHKIDKNYLEQFEAYQEFKNRTNKEEITKSGMPSSDSDQTPDEVLRNAHRKIVSALSADLLEKVRDTEPQFFEQLIVDLLLAMGYGAAGTAGKVIGKSGDNGVDGVINQDPLGVDQVYIQAKRYKNDIKVGAGEIRDFFGALALKDVGKGIFVTTSSFSPSAISTAEKLGARIILIDGVALSQLLIRHNVGCRIEEVFQTYSIDENYFE